MPGITRYIVGLPLQLNCVHVGVHISTVWKNQNSERYFHEKFGVLRPMRLVHYYTYCALLMRKIGSKLETRI